MRPLSKRLGPLISKAVGTAKEAVETAAIAVETAATGGPPNTLTYLSYLAFSVAPPNALTYFFDPKLAKISAN